MGPILTIIISIAVIFILVVAHELGHFTAAKLRKVKVIEFGVGFPPRIFGIKRGETIYSINALPIGAFVKLPGEDDPKVPGSLAGQSIGTRLFVLSAGAIMNVLVPFLLFAVALMVPHQVLKGTVIIEDVSPGSPAAIAGFRPGDTLLAANGQTINSGLDLRRDIQLHMGSPMNFLVKHSDGTQQTLTATPRWKPPAGQGSLGVSTNTTSATIVRESLPFWNAIPEGVVDSVQTFVLFKNGIISMIIGASPAQFTGPVGIVQLTGEYASAGLAPLLEFAAFLSINLAIFNIFPLPAFDGGRIAFVVLEWLRGGKRVAPKTEGLVHFIGFILIIAFFLAVTFGDISRIVRGQPPGG